MPAQRSLFCGVALLFGLAVPTLAQTYKAYDLSPSGPGIAQSGLTGIYGGYEFGEVVTNSGTYAELWKGITNSPMKLSQMLFHFRLP